MTSPAYPTDDEIHAYIDRELAPGRYQEIAAILRADDALAARVALYCADRDSLRQALNGIVSAKLPPAWQTRIEAATGRRRVLPRRQAIAAGVALVLAVGAGAAVFWRPGDGILTQALAARDQGLGDTTPEVGALSDTATRARLASALGLKVQAPDLHRFGFQLARLEVSHPGAPSRAAQLEYRDAAGRRLTIYVRPSDGTVRFDLLRAGAARVCVWQDDVVGAVIIAPMSAGEMMRVASSAYAALNL
jgi:anti-sigma factor RsiW